MSKGLLIYIILLLNTLNVLGQMNPPFIVEDDLTNLNASNFISNFGDVTCERSIDDIVELWNEGSFTTIRKKSNIGFTQVCYWMQFQLINETDTTKNLFIEISNPELEGIDFYIFDEYQQPVKHVTTGSKFPFQQREVDYRNFLFTLNAVPFSIYTIFIKVDKQPNYVNVPVKVWDAQYKIEASQIVEYRLGMFYGIMLLYLFLMGLISYFLKDNYYSYYTFLLALGLAFIFINEGFAFQYFWPKYPWPQNVIRYLILNTYMLVSILFVGNFVKDKLSSNKVFNFIRGGALFLLFISIVILLYPAMNQSIQFWISIILSIVIIIIHFLIFAILYFSYKSSGDKSLIGLVIAYIVAFGIVLTFTLVKFGLIPINIDSSRSIYVGSIIVSVIFSVLLGFRVKNSIADNKNLRTELGLAGIRSSFALLEGQEKERIRVADELHDGVGIKMSALKMKLSSLKYKGDDDGRKQKLTNIIEQVDNSCNNIRSLSHSLVPRNLERYGLSAAIHDLVNESNQRSKIKIIFRQKKLAENIDNISKLAIYRLVEGILNELINRKVEQVSFKLVIIPSIQQASINFRYIGRRVEFGVNRNLATVRSIIQVLNGQVRWTMDTMWSNELDIEIPVVSKTTENVKS
ncbi:MAG: 7TM diverse intracellular signaling domain-containing protein [Chitinophagales bacterium]